MSEPTRARRWKLAAALALLAVAVLALVFLPLKELVRSALERARGFGWAGALAVALLYVPASVLCLPGTPITLATGVTFGFAKTLPCIVLASNLGAWAAFAAGRTIARERVRAWAAASPRMAAVERSVGEQSLRLVFLLRLSPLLPFNLLNYALAVSPVRFRAYAAGTFLGMLPGNVLYCYASAAIGDLGRALAGDVDAGIGGRVLFILGLVSTAVVVFLITRRARAALRGTIDTPDPPGHPH